MSEKIIEVKKRNGSFEKLKPEKIFKRVELAAAKLESIDFKYVANKTIDGLYNRISTIELDNLSILNSALLIFDEPEYSKLAARLLVNLISEEVVLEGIQSFSQSIVFGHTLGLISAETAALVAKHSSELNEAIDEKCNDLYEYYGLRTLYERYFLRHPTTRRTLETPQYFLMRVACGVSNTLADIIDFYHLISSHDYMPSTPVLFNSGTKFPQMSSCFLMDSPLDTLKDIYQQYWEIALISKWSGGLGIAYHRIRSRGSLIEGTNGFSSGIIPWLKTLDDSIAAVNQGGKRKGACCVYLETWHADIEDFLEFRNSTGDQSRRGHHLNIANWIPDLFMKRVLEDGMWSLFDPKCVPQFPDLYGEKFEKAYLKCESKKMYVRQIKARDLFARMMKTLAETGNGWIVFKDTCNQKSNQTAMQNNVIHSSNLCTEIVEVTSDKEVAVCNLGSINLANFVHKSDFDFERLAKTVRKIIPFLDRAIDLNYYPTEKTKTSNLRWRPLGLGVMGLQDVFFKLKLAFDEPKAQDISRKIQEEIYYHALSASCELAENFGPCPAFLETKTAQDLLQFDLWNEQPQNTAFKALKNRIQKAGLRNSLLIAIAPTATIASIVGVYECADPQIANIYKHETLSGEFLQINRYLVADLKKIHLWNDAIRQKIKIENGSIKNIKEIPEELRQIYRTVWEIPMKSLIDMAAARGPFIDQCQSLNLFIENPTISKLASMYMYAWQKGLKTTYYLRSRPATTISKTFICEVCD